MEEVRGKLVAIEKKSICKSEPQSVLMDKTKKMRWGTLVTGTVSYRKHSQG